MNNKDWNVVYRDIGRLAENGPTIETVRSAVVYIDGLQYDGVSVPTSVNRNSEGGIVFEWRLPSGIMRVVVMGNSVLTGLSFMGEAKSFEESL